MQGLCPAAELQSPAAECAAAAASAPGRAAQGMACRGSNTESPSHAAQMKPALDAIRSLGTVLESSLQLLLPVLVRLITPGASAAPLMTQDETLVTMQEVLPKMQLAGEWGVCACEENVFVCGGEGGRAGEMESHGQGLSVRRTGPRETDITRLHGPSGSSSPLSPLCVRTARTGMGGTPCFRFHTSRPGMPPPGCDRV